MDGGRDAVEFGLREDDGFDGRGEGKTGAFAEDDEFDEIRCERDDFTGSSETVAETVFGIAASVARAERAEQRFGASGESAGSGHPRGAP